MVSMAASYRKELEQLKSMFAEIHRDPRRRKNIQKVSEMLGASAKSSPSTPGSNIRIDKRRRKSG